MSASRASRRLASAPWPVYSWAAALGLLAATARAEVVTVTDATWAETVATGNSQWMVELCAPPLQRCAGSGLPGTRAASLAPFCCSLVPLRLHLPPLSPRAGRPFSRRPGWRSYAPWCGHCKAFAPVWEEVAEKLGPSTGLKFAKVDATYEPESAGKFGVKSYPKIFFLDKSYAQDVRPAALAGRACPRP